MILLLNMVTIDVASFLDPATLGISVIIRNEKGEDMAALSVKRSAKVDSNEVEQLACRKAICFAIEPGFKDLVIKGDNVYVMWSLSRSDQFTFQGGHILQDFQVLRCFGCKWNQENSLRLNTVATPENFVKVFINKHKLHNLIK